VSAWVSANAGSGKTHVLAQRVIRILLEGTSPGKILCLTFTRTAAANMASRVYQTLAKWTLLTDAELTREILATGAARPNAAGLLQARRLFARTIETPGGLKIQTIHAFCERLLHLFPFEANMTAGFSVMEETRQAQILAQARIWVLEAAIVPGHELNDALQRLASLTTADEFDELLKNALKFRGEIAERAMENHEDILAKALGETEYASIQTLQSAILRDGLLADADFELPDILERGKATDIKRAAKLRSARALMNAGKTALAVEKYFSAFFSSDGAEIAKILITKDLANAHPGWKQRLEDEALRIYDLRLRLRVRITVEKTGALLKLIQAIFERYEAEKRALSLIDFDDLIDRTRNLLHRSDSQWVLYKLDAGIEHVLVDEAQDTSPGQWDILKTLVEEFSSGEGQSYRVRTLFAVGDEKQSIYSFQGAAPHMFAEMRGHFHGNAKQAGQAFENVQLNLSFRSSPVVLSAVDAVFQSPQNRQGLTASGDQIPPHEAWRRNLPGLVEIWDWFAKIDTVPSLSWAMPTEIEHSKDAVTRLSDAVAAQIAELVKPDSIDLVHDRETGEPRRVNPGDILVLVRSRNAVFDNIISALKDIGVPVAGADKLVLTDHIAVQDLMALGALMLLPADDLNLAIVLKSPLIGLTDDDLMLIAPNRMASLWEVLQQAEAPHLQLAARQLAEWHRQAQQCTPFRFYAGILGRDGGRRAIDARLGLEASDAVDEFMRLALEHEREEAPSLVHFLNMLQIADLQVKRDMEAAGPAVRVMTVHGAKGLEAKIVFLPDTCANPRGHKKAGLVDVQAHAVGTEGDNHQGAALLAWTHGDRPGVVESAISEAEELAVEESRRLLYVAMTRAEERLYVAGFNNFKNLPAGCWYSQIFEALTPQMQSSPARWDTNAKIWRLGARAVQSGALADMARQSPPPLPDWLRRAAPTEANAAPPISPSRVLESADQFDPSTTAPLGSGVITGQALHTLLQYLPEVASADRRIVGRRWLKGRKLAVDVEKLLDQVLAVLNHPDYALLFGPNSRAEVSIAGEISGFSGRKLAIGGQIDRVAVEADTVWIVDYKTGRPKMLADTPAQYLAQLALYRFIMQKIYPGHQIRALILWTAGPELIEIDAARLDAALRPITGAGSVLDGSKAAS
ncbi:MAG: double-strand break repair helicase AddA, partial [Hyphomicrobiales bacterium]|nr:double-strand break repair helicase AddA [Hyphomicrobiales bacterium]